VAETNKKISLRIKLLFVSIAPGIFLIGYNIGTGSITTTASAGAKTGMMMIWPLLLSCIFTFILIITFGRFTMVTGDTALYGFRKHFGKPWAIAVLVSLIGSEIGSFIGNMGIVTQVVQEWSRPYTQSGHGFSPIILAVIFGTILYLFFWTGKHPSFEKILAVFVSLMGLSFVITMFLVKPDPAELIRGLVPRLPGDAKSAIIMAGMVGTTMGAVIVVVRSILVQEKGWTIKDIKIEKRDALISVTLMFILSAAIMICAAGTLHPLGLEVDNAIDMVKLLEPLAGRFAISIFVAGIVSAAMSSLFPIILLGPWLLADYSNKPRNMRTPIPRLMAVIMILLGLTVPVFGAPPVLVLLITQVGNIVITPLIIILMLILQNKKELMGEHKASQKLNLGIFVVFLFSVLMSVIGIVGVLNIF
jgi:manganese transport protein